MNSPLSIARDVPSRVSMPRQGWKEQLTTTITIPINVNELRLLYIAGFDIVHITNNKGVLENGESTPRALR